MATRQTRAQKRSISKVTLTKVATTKTQVPRPNMRESEWNMPLYAYVNVYSVSPSTPQLVHVLVPASEQSGHAERDSDNLFDNLTNFNVFVIKDSLSITERAKLNCWMRMSTCESDWSYERE